jgi:hypothetical protein
MNPYRGLTPQPYSNSDVILRDQTRKSRMAASDAGAGRRLLPAEIDRRGRKAQWVLPDPAKDCPLKQTHARSLQASARDSFS